MGILYSSQMCTGKRNLVTPREQPGLRESIYLPMQCGSGTFANVIFLVNTHKRWFQRRLQRNWGLSASYIRTLQQLIDVPFPPQ